MTGSGGGYGMLSASSARGAMRLSAPIEPAVAASGTAARAGPGKGVSFSRRQRLALARTSLAVVMRKFCARVSARASLAAKDCNRRERESRNRELPLTTAAHRLRHPSGNAGAAFSTRPSLSSGPSAAISLSRDSGLGLAKRCCGKGGYQAGGRQYKVKRRIRLD